MKKSKKQFGFTLIEILLVIALGTIILTALYGVFVISLRSHERGTAQQEITQNARIALERISRDLRQTDRIATSLPSDQNNPIDPPLNEIQFQDGHYHDKIRYIRYYQDQTNLKRQIVHYYFSNDPETWVAWNALDQSSQPPEKSVDEDVTKADKLVSIKFYGNKVIIIEIIVGDGKTNFNFKTAVFGRNI